MNHTKIFRNNIPEAERTMNRFHLKKAAFRFSVHEEFRKYQDRVQDTDRKYQGQEQKLQFYSREYFFLRASATGNGTRPSIRFWYWNINDRKDLQFLSFLPELKSVQCQVKIQE